MKQPNNTKTKIYSTALYMRLSRDDENFGDSVSIETQRTILQKFAAENGLRVYGEYVDDGWSGTNFDRPSFQRMMNDVEAGKVNCIVTKDLSRFGREHVMMDYYLEFVFPEKQIRYIAIAENEDTEKGLSEFVPFKNLFNEWFAKDTSRKVKSALHAKFEKGERIFAYAPLGYKRHPEIKNTLTPDEETRWIVLASELMVASLTLLPTFVPEGRRGLASLGGFTGCLLLLLLVCCLYTGGDWFLIAGVSVLFGMGLVFLPFALRALPLPEELAHRKVSLYVGIELLLLLALFGVACLYTGGTWFLSAALWTVFGLGIALLPLLLRQLPLPWNWSRHKAVVYLSFESILLLAGLAWEGRTGDFPLPMLPIALLCLALPWGWLGALRYLPLGRWFRAGVGLAWTGLWIWLAPFVLDQIYLHMGYFTSTPYQLILPIDFHNWAAAMSANVMFLIILGFLLLGLLCVVAGILWRRTHPRTSAPEA